MSSTILDFLAEKKGEIDDVIKKYLPDKVSEKYIKWLLGEPSYEYTTSAIQAALSEPIWDFLNRGGKRWRPALFLLYTEALGGDVKKVKDFTSTLELLHEGCLTGDTPVLKNPGEHVRIDSINPGDYVYTVSPEGNLESSVVMKKKMTGIRDVYRLVTSHREIKATRNHHFLVMHKNQPIRFKITPYGANRLKRALPRGGIIEAAKKLGKNERVMYNALIPGVIQYLEKSELEYIFDMAGLKLSKKDYFEKETKYQRPEMKLGWKKLEELEPDEMIIALRKIPDKGKPLKLPIPDKDPYKDRVKVPSETSEDFCQIFGYVLGDGCVRMNENGSWLYLTPSENSDEKDSYKKIFKRTFDYSLRSEIQNGYEKLFCCSYKVCWLMRELGLEKSALTKKIPPWIYGLPEKQKAAFIRGYLDSDGTVRKNGSVSFDSASEELIRGLKLLVDSMGMTTGRVTKRKVKNLWKASKKKESTIWSIRMSNPGNILKLIGTERNDYRNRMIKANKGRNFNYGRNYPKPPINMEQFRFEPVKSIEMIDRCQVYDIMVENSHNFIADNIVVHNSIMVDDIEDSSDLRRGKPCTHKIFGEDIAINAGNFMYFLAFAPFLKHKNEFKPEVMNRALNSALEEMIRIHYGQAADIAWHKGLADADNIKEDEYLQMCAYKTGVLARLSARLAVILSEGSEELEAKLGKFSESIGVAFQIQDDIMNIDPSDGWGKETGDDINEGKRTLLVLHAVKNAEKPDKERLLEILKMHTKDRKLIEEAISIIKKYGSVQYAKEFAREMVKRAWADVEPLLPENESKEKLKAFADFMVEREI